MIRRSLKAAARTRGGAGYPSAPAVSTVAIGALAAAGLALPRVNPLLVLAVAVIAVPLLLILRSPRSVVLGTLSFLPFLGLVRRASGSYTANLDPATLLGPLVAVACLAVVARRDRGRYHTPLAGSVLALLVLGLVEIANPLQGGLSVGVAGAGLFVGPLVWFFVGQRMGDERTLYVLTKALQVVVIVVALYGVKQVLFGFSGFEQRWITSNSRSYQALDIGGTTRPFSTFASGAEYAYFLFLGALLLTASRLGLPRILRLLVICGLLAACFYSGNRGIFVTACVAVGLTVLVRRIPSLGAALAASVAVALVGLALLQFVPLASGDTAAAKIRNRTLGGLTQPFDPQASTLGLHVSEFTNGMSVGLGSPVGKGAATVNNAGTKLGGTSASAEHDIPNVLIAYGWLGLVLLLMIVARTYRLVGECVRRGRRDLFGPAIFVVGMFGAWFVGGLYSVSALVWFFLGSIDRQISDGDAVDAAEGTTAPSLVDSESTLV